MLLITPFAIINILTQWHVNGPMAFANILNLCSFKLQCKVILIILVKTISSIGIELSTLYQTVSWGINSGTLTTDILYPPVFRPAYSVQGRILYIKIKKRKENHNGFGDIFINLVDIFKQIKNK